MSDQDIAHETGLPLLVVQAFRATESGGIASAVRFEPHLFLRTHPEYGVFLNRADPQLAAKRHDAAAHGEVPYTHGATRAASDSRVETDRAAFERAYHLAPDTAVRSTSWGAFQVLGGTALDRLPPRSALYPSPASFVAAFDAAPMAVSDALLTRYLLSRPAIVAAAKRCDWRAVVHMYNGCPLECAADGTVIGDGKCARYLERFRRALAAAGWPATG